jgi:hypothetical protein
MDPGLILIKMLRAGRPCRMRELHYSRRFTPVEYSRVRLGLVPLSPADRWFIFFHAGTLRFHRSGNGILVYEAGFARRGDHFEAVRALVNDDPAQIEPLPGDFDCRFLDYLIDRLLLDRDLPFPAPEGADAEETPLLERIWMGDNRPARA